MIKHLDEEQLVLFHYGEHPDRAGAAGHMASCAACRTACEHLTALLAQVGLPAAPERGADYGREVWLRLCSHLAVPASPARLAWWPLRRWAMAGAVAALLAAAFLAGRFWPAQPLPERVRERILLVALGDHLDRSQMVLLELENIKPAGEVDIAADGRRADDLIPANRLYRQSAVRAGEAGLASVLEELELVLLDIARSPARLSAAQFEELRRRFETQGILFKVRILDGEVRREAAPPEPGRTSS